MNKNYAIIKKFNCFGQLPNSDASEFEGATRQSLSYEL